MRKVVFAHDLCAIALGLSSMSILLLHGGGPLSTVAQTLFATFQGHYTLLAIPFFILASTFMSTGGVASRITRFAIATTGHFPGGLAIASVVACMIFAALSGSSPATVVAIGTIVIAAMQQAGYRKDFAVGVIANAGTLGILIPPSIVMVIYASATDVSVGRMFIAGIVPGLLAGLLLIIGVLVVSRYRKLPSRSWAGWGEVLLAGRTSVWGLLLIVIILGGIYGGAFTPTEAAAVAAVYAFLVANFVYRDMGPFKEGSSKTGNTVFRALSAFWHEDNRAVLLESGKMTITLMFIIGNAFILKHVLSEERIPQLMAEAILGIGVGQIVFLLIVNLVLLIGGQFLEPSGLILIVAPLVFPIAMHLGIDPIHLGIIMIVNMEIGMVTPPVGLNLFATSAIARMSILSVVRAALPFVSIL